LSTLLAHGAFVTMIDKTGFDGWLDPVAYQRMGRVLGEARQKREHFGQRPFCEVGLYFSSRTRDWIGREQPGQVFQSFQGTHQACVTEHVPFGVVLDENVSAEVLASFPVVCLANVGIVSPREVELLTDYVQQGGHLLVTGHSGQFDRHGQPLAQSVLADLIGARVLDRLESLDNWVKLDAPNATSPETEQIADGLRPDWPFLVKGPATVYQATTARAYGQLLRPLRTARQMQGKMGTEWPMNADAPVGPALLVHHVGQGRVVTCAASPGYATASEHAIVEARRLLVNAARLLRPSARIDIQAPANVEAVVTHDPPAGKLRVHFIAYNPTPRTTPPNNRPYVLPGLIEDAPIYRVTVTLAETPSEVAALEPDTQVHVDGNRIQATINAIHDVLIIDCPSGLPQ
jgi:hypothetical protein